MGDKGQIVEGPTEHRDFLFSKWEQVATNVYSAARPTSKTQQERRLCCSPWSGQSVFQFLCRQKWALEPCTWASVEPPTTCPSKKKLGPSLASQEQRRGQWQPSTFCTLCKALGPRIFLSSAAVKRTDCKRFPFPNTPLELSQTL